MEMNNSGQKRKCVVLFFFFGSCSSIFLGFLYKISTVLKKKVWKAVPGPTKLFFFSCSLEITKNKCETLEKKNKRIKKMLFFFFLWNFFSRKISKSLIISRKKLEKKYIKNAFEVIILICAEKLKKKVWSTIFFSFLFQIFAAHKSIRIQIKKEEKQEKKHYENKKWVKKKLCSYPIHGGVFHFFLFFSFSLFLSFVFLNCFSRIFNFKFV